MTQPPAPQLPDPATLATLRLHLQGSALTRMIPPTVQVNGTFVRANFGVTDVPVYAGPVHVHCESKWMRTYGRADLSYQAAPGNVTDVWYAMPMHQFTDGSIGYVKQKSRGLGTLATIVVALLAVVVLLVILAAQGGS